MKPDARISSSVMTSTGTACSSTFLAKRDPRTETELPETALDASEKFSVAEPSTFTETLADSYPMYEAVTGKGSCWVSVGQQKRCRKDAGRCRTM